MRCCMVTIHGLHFSSHFYYTSLIFGNSLYMWDSISTNLLLPMYFYYNTTKRKSLFPKRRKQTLFLYFLLYMFSFFLLLLDYFYKITSRSLSALLFFRCKASRLQMPFPFSVPAPFLLHPQKQFLTCCLHTGCQKPHFQTAVSP